MTSGAGERLAKHAWSKPNHYAGFSPDGDFVIASQHRDNDALTRSNFACIKRDLDKLVETLTESEQEACGEFGCVYDWRASHWAVGWVDYLMINQHASQRILDEAALILGMLADYPAHDEMHWSELEYDEAARFWAAMPVRERVRMIKDSHCGASVFAARRDELPEDDAGALYDYLRG